MKSCPSCGNETTETVFDGQCFFCGNTDFSEEAELLRDYEYRKVNCGSCGKLMTTNQGHWYNQLFYKFPKRVRLAPLDGVRLCDKCDDEISPKGVSFKKVIKRVEKGVMISLYQPKPKGD